MITARKLGTLIRYLREKKELTSMDLAELVPRSTSGIIEIENGKRFPKISLLVDICKVLEVDLSLIVLFLDNEEQLDKDYLDTFDFHKTIDYSTIKTNYLIDKELNEEYQTSKKNLSSEISTDLKNTENQQIQELKIQIQELKDEKKQLYETLANLGKTMQINVHLKS